MLRRIKEKFWNMKFRRKLLFSHTMVCVIPIVILGFFCYQQVLHLMMEREKESLSQSMKQAEQTVDAELESYGNIVTYLSMHSQIQDYLKKDYQNTSKDYYVQHEFYMNLLAPTMLNLGIQHDGLDNISIYTENPMSYRSEVIMSLQDVKEEEWAKEALKKKVIEWYREGKKRIRCVLAFRAMEENKEALLSVNINYKKLFEPFHNLVGENYGVLIADKQDRVFMEHDTFDQENKEKCLKIGELKEAVDNQTNRLNHQYLIFSQELKTTGWEIYLYKPYSDIRASVSNIANGVIMIIIVCVLLLCMIIPLLSGSVANRLEHLTYRIQKINLDNLEEKIGGEGKDEVGILISNINKMLGRIHSLIDEVYKTKLAKKRFELKALQAQINPHFLYNTMSLINCQAILVGQKEISELSQAISNFYRTALNKGKDTIFVRDELENTKAYLYIQSVMHNHNFDIEYDIDEAVYTEKIINLILQPLVENAIEHGIDCKINGERGHLFISAKKKEEKVIFTVEDNGAGIPENKTDTLLQTGTSGYGIKNVNDRIQLLYGSAYGITIHSREGQGTKVEICIPVENSTKK